MGRVSVASFVGLALVCALAGVAASRASIAALQREQVASGALSQAEADAGLVITRVLNEEFIARAGVSGDDTQYDEAFAKQAADYSAAAYYDGQPDQALNYKAQNTDFELGAKVTKPYPGGDISAFTGIDKKKNLIVVGYEGTSNGVPQLAMEGIQATPRDVPGCPGCTTTKYFGDASAKLYPDIQKSVKELQAKCPNCQVVVTGHSLGGAMAQNGAFQMMQDGTLKTPPKFYTFGQPKTGNPAYNDAFNKKIPNAFRVVHDTDLVPTVGARARGTNIGKEVAYDDAMKSYQICTGAGCGNKLKSELLKDVKTNAANTLGRPAPTWKDVFMHPIKSTGDILRRPIDFAVAEGKDLKEDLAHSVGEHTKYFGNELGSEFDDQKKAIEADAAKKAAEKAAADKAAAANNRPVALMSALPPSATEEKLDDKKPTIKDKVSKLLDAKAKDKKAKDKKQAKDAKDGKTKVKVSAKAKDAKSPAKPADSKVKTKTKVKVTKTPLDTKTKVKAKDSKAKAPKLQSGAPVPGVGAAAGAGIPFKSVKSKEKIRANGKPKTKHQPTPTRPDEPANGSAMGKTAARHSKEVARGKAASANGTPTRKADMAATRGRAPAPELKPTKLQSAGPSQAPAAAKPQKQRRQSANRPAKPVKPAGGKPVRSTRRASANRPAPVTRRIKRQSSNRPAKPQRQRRTTKRTTRAPRRAAAPRRPRRQAPKPQRRRQQPRKPARRPAPARGTR